MGRWSFTAVGPIVAPDPPEGLGQGLGAGLRRQSLVSVCPLRYGRMGPRNGADLTTALCPGSFDPPTNGHLDVIWSSRGHLRSSDRRGGREPGQDPVISPPRAGSNSFPSCWARKWRWRPSPVFWSTLPETRRSTSWSKGLRAGVDFDYELQMAQMNYDPRRDGDPLHSDQPSVELPLSSLVREVARLGGMSIPWSARQCCQG